MWNLMPFVILMVFFVLIGGYFAIFTRHFLGWTSRYNEMLHREIDRHLARPVLVARAQMNYARLQSNGGLNFLTWSIRMIGAALVVISIINICRIFGSIS